MKTKTCRSYGPILRALWLVPLSPVALSAGEWWVEVGPALRDMNVKVSGSSYVQQEGLHNPLAAGPLTAPAGVGNPSSYANRIYDNGYVNLDSGTGNPNTINPNTTWNWGFNNPLQYNAVAQTLTFQAEGSPGYTTLRDTGASGSDDLLGAGFQAVVGRTVLQRGRWSASLFFRLQCAWSGDDRINSSTYGEEVRQITVTDTYDTSKIGVAGFPATGYQGTYAGPFGTQSPPYPLLPNLPASRTEVTSAALASSYNSIGLDVNPSLYELGLGPQIAFQATHCLQLHLRPTISLEIVDADVNRSESFAGMNWSDQASKTGALLGMGGTAGANLDLGHGFYVGVSGGYTYVPHGMEVSVGPNTVKVDPGGWEVGCAIGRHF
jgi:hypothetical protein